MPCCSLNGGLSYLFSELGQGDLQILSSEAENKSRSMSLKVSVVHLISDSSFAL